MLVNKKISVIIPMFNSEDFIESTIESVTSQSMKDIEIIMIDDGSNDRTYQIALNFSAQHKNIVVLKNSFSKGVSGARNSGLEVAKGEYVFFLDSDDILPRNSLENMYRLAMAHKADIVTGIYERFDSKSQSIVQFFNQFPQLKIEGPLSLINNPYIVFSVYSCGKLFKRNLIENVKFNEDLHYGEDQVFTIKSLLRAKTIINSSDVVYKYRIRDGESESASQSVYKDPLTNLEQVLSMLELIRKELRDYIQDSFLRRSIYSLYLKRVIHWNIWTAISSGLLSMNISYRVSVMTRYADWVKGLDKETINLNSTDLKFINERIIRIIPVLDFKTQKICESLIDQTKNLSNPEGVPII
ncbi:glycosyltransferase family 2 protein [Paenibacillus sp. 7523-1]|uniref:glycosyltransferase family 2 protein n=1 Tax=Paenibacillus sp. 7523-1 TaxID=2022550 RepID=UPI000BA527EC|nr:glycosyltransferase family 2 protein [Paenibacillus sp. 7523-1]PAD30658.1 hypothetical protein CHH60_15075 [Paenibacillus sp. 7523-1]